MYRGVIKILKPFKEPGTFVTDYLLKETYIVIPETRSYALGFLTTSYKTATQKGVNMAYANFIATRDNHLPWSKKEDLECYRVHRETIREWYDKGYIELMDEFDIPT